VSKLEEVMQENRELKATIHFINSEYKDADNKDLTLDALVLKLRALEVENAHL